MNLEEDFDDFIPSKIHVCNCEQCRLTKNKRKNRNLKNRIRRMLNKKRRKQSGSRINFYLA